MKIYDCSDRQNKTEAFKMLLGEFNFIKIFDKFPVSALNGSFETEIYEKLDKRLKISNLEQ